MISMENSIMIKLKQSWGTKKNSSRFRASLAIKFLSKQTRIQTWSPIPSPFKLWDLRASYKSLQLVTMRIIQQLKNWKIMIQVRKCRVLIRNEKF